MQSPDLWEMPEWAIASFESLTKLRITVHDLGTELGPFLPPERFKHSTSCCMAVKATHDWACIDFEITRLRRDIAGVAEGRCHVCHAGLQEWVLPVMIDGRLEWILFAGQARAVEDFEGLAKDGRQHDFPFIKSAALPKMNREESGHILEALRQLRARLIHWHRELLETLPQFQQTSKRQSGDRASRQLAIQAFLYQHHADDVSIGRLAEHLGVSESRASHLVKELFGNSYIQLLNRMRLRTAASLLRSSSLSVLEVCLASGFCDLSHFHRVFRRRFKVTPLQYRKQCDP